MKHTKSWPVAVMVAAALLLPLNSGCDEFFREAASFLNNAADELDDFADDLDDRHDRHNAGDWFVDVLDDIEDWFD